MRGGEDLHSGDVARPMEGLADEPPVLPPLCRKHRSSGHVGPTYSRGKGVTGSRRR